MWQIRKKKKKRKNRNGLTPTAREVEEISLLVFHVLRGVDLLHVNFPFAPPTLPQSMDPLARDLFRPSKGNPLPSAGSKKYPTAVALESPWKGEEGRKTEPERERGGIEEEKS